MFVTPVSLTRPCPSAGVRYDLCSLPPLCRLVSPCLVLPCRALSCFAALSCPLLFSSRSCLVLSCLLLSYLILSYLILSFLRVCTQGVAFPPHCISHACVRQGGSDGQSPNTSTLCPGALRPLRLRAYAPRDHSGYVGALRTGTRLANRAASCGAGREAPGIEPGSPRLIPP